MDPNDRGTRERTLLRAVLAGDEAAWELWYRESFDRLYAYVSWRSGGLRELADEIVQETWLTAVRRIRQFDPARGSFEGWLRGIAANVFRNQLRRKRRDDRVSEAAVAPDRKAEAPRRDQAERVALALSELPDHYETVLRAKYLEQQSVNQIAATLGQTTKAVESLLTRARDAFREAYLKEDRER
jgi:RNA polymerase sigma-70 factor (ECF subfamily)